MKLLLGALCTLLFLNSLCTVDGAIEWDLKTSKELQRRVRSSFYLLGYCSAAKSSECSNLKSLLYSSEEKTRGTSVRTAMLVYDAAYWRPAPNTSSPTNLWFACHDGQQIRVTPCNSAGLNALMDDLAVAMQQQGPVCIAGEVHNLNPAAPAAAAAEETETLTEAFLQGLDMYYQRSYQWTWLVVFNGAVILAIISCVSGVSMKQKKMPTEEPDARIASIFIALIAVTVAIKLGIDMFLQLVFGMEGTISWWWVILIFCMIVPFGAALSDTLQPSPEAGDVECTPIDKSASEASEATQSPNSTPATSTATTPTACTESGYQPVSTTEDKPPAPQRPASDLLGVV